MSRMIQRVGHGPAKGERARHARHHDDGILANGAAGQLGVATDRIGVFRERPDVDRIRELVEDRTRGATTGTFLERR